jgi:hypothetical protein
MGFLSAFFGRQPAGLDAIAAPTRLSAAGAADFAVLPALRMSEGLPTLDWQAVGEWLLAVPDPAEQARAFAAAERAWLAHLRDALGPNYRLTQRGNALLLSSEPARATLDFMTRAAQRIARVLDGLTQPDDEWGQDILIVLDDEDTYYRYVARYYAEDGTYATSGGMFINDGCGHFVTCKDDLYAIEPTIVHEMTHASLAHLPLPLWLNEGLAVNTEHRLAPRPGERGVGSVMQQRHQQHRNYWDAARMQQFWSGALFGDTGDGRMLSYNLAALLVGQFARDWNRFRAFVLAADAADAGQAAALAHLGLGLGEAVGALLECPDMAAAWQPNAEQWSADVAENAPMRDADSGVGSAGN